MPVPTTCPECTAVYQFEGGNTHVCPECSHEWTPETETK